LSYGPGGRREVLLAVDETLRGHLAGPSPPPSPALRERELVCATGKRGVSCDQLFSMKLRSCFDRDG
jgi:hypothetical protein